MHNIPCVHAGSVYCDVHLKEAGFNGEEIRSGSVLVVKTHKAKFTWTNITVPQYTREVSVCVKSCTVIAF